MLAPAAVIPLTDSEHAVLPVQFALDPGPQVDWGRDENNPNMLTTLQLADQEKLVLLKVDMSNMCDVYITLFVVTRSIWTWSRSPSHPAS